MVDFGSEQGLSDFESAGIACYFEDFKRTKTKLRAKRCRFWMDTRKVKKQEKMQTSKYPDSPRVGVGAVVFNDNRVLLIKRGKRYVGYPRRARGIRRNPSRGGGTGSA